MRRPLQFLLTGLGLFCAASVAAQSFIPAPDLNRPLAAKWQWALDTSAANADTSSWIVYQFTTTLDEKLSPFVFASGYNYVQWNSQHDSGPYINGVHFPAAAGWTNGVSTAALLAGNTGSQQEFPRERELVVIARYAHGQLDELVIDAPETPFDWRHQPVYWLGAVSTTESLRLLQGELDVDREGRLNRALLRGLGLHMTPERTATLLSLYEDPDWAELRPALIESLALQTSPDIETLLLDIGDDANAPLVDRRIAISALSRFPATRVKDTLIALAGPLNPQDIRLEAIESLAHYPGAEVTAFLDELLTSESADFSEDAASRAIARQALSALAGRAGQMPRITALAREHEDARLRRIAINRLVQMDAVTAFPTLQWLAENDPVTEVRESAVSALRHAPESLAVPVLLAISGAVADQDLDVRRESIQSLGRFPTPAVQDRLNEIAWSDTEARLRKEAIDSLADHDSVRAQRLLLELARNHPNRQTSAAAIQKLQQELFR